MDEGENNLNLELKELNNVLLRNNIFSFQECLDNITILYWDFQDAINGLNMKEDAITEYNWQDYLLILYKILKFIENHPNVSILNYISLLFYLFHNY